MADPSQHSSSPNRRAVWATLLYVCFLIAGIFAAGQAHVFFFGAADPPAEGGRGDLRVWRPTTQGRLDPADPIASTLASVSLGTFTGQPGNLTPPLGARRVHGQIRRGGGCVDEMVCYELEGAVAKAAGHYLAMLKQRGFRILSDRTIEPADRVIVAVSRRSRATITLRKLPAKDKIVQVVVLVVRDEVKTNREKGTK